MPEDRKTLEQTICDQVVNDYFTPNIKAEVILDTLLTPYITEIVAGQMGAQVGRLRFLTKEMSILEAAGTDDRGTKIDYVLEDEKGWVYLVELKTTNGGINNSQMERYLDNCCGKTFGEALGDKLLTLVGKKFPPADPWKEDPRETFLETTKGYDADKNTARARNFLKANKRASTNKYIYTVGQLLDHHSGSLQSLWDTPLRLLYLTPDGNGVFPNPPKRKDKREQAEARQLWQARKEKWEQFYRGPQGTESSISLIGAVGTLRGIGTQGAQLLTKIITGIYLPEEGEQ